MANSLKINSSNKTNDLQIHFLFKIFKFYTPSLKRTLLQRTKRFL